MSEIEFVGALPGSANVGNTRMHRKRMSEFALALRDRPGEWAIYPYPSTDLSARAIASRISRGKIAAFGDGYEATATKGTVYVRYVGDAS